MMFSKVVIGLGCLFVGRAAATNFPIVLEQPELSDPAAKLASFLGGGNGRELTVHQSQEERKLFNIVAQGERKLYNIVAEGEFPCTPSPLEFRFEFTLTAGTEYTIDVIPDQEQCILFPIAYIYLNGGLQATSFNAFRRCGGIGDPFFLFVPPTTATYVIRVGVYFQQDCRVGDTGKRFSISIFPYSQCETPTVDAIDPVIVFVEGALGANATNGELNVTASDPEGLPLTYNWTTTCPNATLTNETTPNAHMTVLSETQPVICMVNVSVCRSCGECLDSEGMITIVDPAAGFVTGGGYILSPEGAYTPKGNLTGKANFGFVSKYKKGQSVPSGETQFSFNTAGFKFKSDSYKWLVITAQPCAKYKGLGIVEGEDEEFGFMLTACDNGEPGTDVDTFRIKVWSTNTTGVIYDNKLGLSDDLYNGTTISGGNIQIQEGGKGGNGGNNNNRNLRNALEMD